jgi:hypothetical protein
VSDETKSGGAVTPEMIEAGWRAYWESGIALEREKLEAAYRAMRALEPKGHISIKLPKWYEPKPGDRLVITTGLSPAEASFTMRQPAKRKPKTKAVRST